MLGWGGVEKNTGTLSQRADPSHSTGYPGTRKPRITRPGALQRTEDTSAFCSSHCGPLPLVPQVRSVRAEEGARVAEVHTGQRADQSEVTVAQKRK